MIRPEADVLRGVFPKPVMVDTTPTDPPALHTFRVEYFDHRGNTTHTTHRSPGWGIDPSGALCIMSEAGPVKVQVAYAAGAWDKVVWVPEGKAETSWPQVEL